MAWRLHCGGLFVMGMIGFAMSAAAQQPAGDAPSPSASSSQAPPAPPDAGASSSSSTVAAPQAASAPAAPPPGPSPDTIKKARSLGMHPETTKSGATVFCWEDANIGTRFTTKKCATEAQLRQVIDQKELLRDQMRRGMTGSSSK